MDDVGDAVDTSDTNDDFLDASDKNPQHMNEEIDAQWVHEENAKRCKIDDKVAGTTEASNEVNEKSDDAGTASSSSGGEKSGPSTDTQHLNREREEASDSDDDPDFEMELARELNFLADGDRAETRIRRKFHIRTSRREENAMNSSHDEYELSSSSSSSTSTSLSVSEDQDQPKPSVLLKPKPRHNWFIVPELQSRQFGMGANKQSSELFQRRCYGSLHCVERLELMYKLEKHTGCVNALNFHPNGMLLASGSDDLSVVIWDWKLGKSLLSFDSKHKSNVFQSKFLPLCGDDLHIVTCARDGHVRLARVSAQGGFRGGRKLGSHHGPTHKLSILSDQPQIVISVGEDGLILKHDLRNTKAEKLHIVQRDGMEIPLYSISSNPLNTYEYCVSGRDATVRSFDQRFPSKTLNTYIPSLNWSDNQNLHVTCAVYNHNGSEILASYNDEDIYLFDVHGKAGTYIHSYEGHRNGATVKGVSFFGPKSEFIVSGSDCGYVYFWEKESQAIVQFLRADDNGIVNCLEPHPQIPFICTSGLDPDIKVWVPSYEHDPVFADLEDNVKLNVSARTDRSDRWHSPGASYDSQFLWLLWRQISHNTEQLRSTINLSMDDLSNPRSSTSSSTSSSSSDDGSDSEEVSAAPNNCTFS